MADPNDLPTTGQLTEYVTTGAHEAFLSGLAQYESAAAEDRKAALRALRALATEQPAAFPPVLLGVVTFLTDEERSIRLTAAKLFVAVADVEPAAVGDVAAPLVDRLADEDEFYYVRARAAEALGYVARSDPDAVDSPAFLAELRVGLSFDEPEVVAKLAKALECVALGRPQRLAHHTAALAAHLDDGDELVRYHLCTAITAVGCERPAALVDCRGALVDRLDDDNRYVRGRAAEAVGLLARVDEPGGPLPEERLASLRDDEASFVAERARFALGNLADHTGDSGVPDAVGTVEGLREGTEPIVEDVTSPDEDRTCSQCGHVLPEHGPPLCPRCGGP